MSNGTDVFISMQPGMGETQMFDIKTLAEELELEPEELLICAIIESGIREKDEEYFSGPAFRAHCRLLKLDAHAMKRRCLEAMK